MEQQPSMFSVPIEDTPMVRYGASDLEQLFDQVAKSRGVKRVGPISWYPDGSGTGVRALVVEL